jgi:acyl-coenzyme A synthetase/AMP-(fatty) acid ligase
VNTPLHDQRASTAIDLRTSPTPDAIHPHRSMNAPALPASPHPSAIDTALWPLCGHAASQALVRTEAGAISAADFVQRAQNLAQQLPPDAAILNVCHSHFGFSLGFAAALLRGCVTLQPPNFAPETVRLLQRVLPHTLADAATAQPNARTPPASHIVCLHDGGDPSSLPDLPALNLQAWLSAPPPRAAAAGVNPSDFAMPQLRGDQLASLVFTSGSTGEPSGHRKTWGKLVLNARSAQARLAWAPGTLVATVPPQHMYGFESSVLLALHGGHAMWHGKPLLPADIAQALAASPAPRYLISTPWHLSLMVDAMDAGLQLAAPATPDTPTEATAPRSSLDALGGPAAPAAVDAVLSATAPLSTELAQCFETRLGAPVHEIYGSTETGQIATHRTVQGADWQLLDGVRLHLQTSDDGPAGDEIAWLSEGHIEGRVPLADLVQQLDDTHFRLMGRRADMVNIAGKRHSIAALNAILQRLPGVKDGAFFDPSQDTASEAIQRLCAFVVAPGQDAKAITQALRAHLDPVFLPRPLWLLDSLPRNATSKLPRSALQALHAQLNRPRS